MVFISKKHKLGRVTIPLETQKFSNAKQPDGNFVYMLAHTKIGINKKSCKPVKFEKLAYKMDGSKTRNRQIPDRRVHDSKLVYEHPGRWYLVVQFDKPVISTQPPFKDISCDPGVRGFMNVYSDDAKLEGVLDLNNRVEVLNKLHSKIKRAQWLRS